MEEKDLTKKQTMGASLVLAIASMFFWNSWWVVPVKYLTVFFHEMSHGIMAILTGGSIVTLNLNFQQGGLCVSRGGIFSLILCAGYLGSLIWGCVLLILSGKYRKSKEIINFLCVVTCIGIYLSSGWQTITIMCGLLGMLLFIGNCTKPQTREILVNFFALSSCMYVIYDIADDLIFRTVAESDASQLAKLIGFGCPSILVGLVWLAIAGFVTWKTLDYVLDK